jgi:hypothetical protein
MHTDQALERYPKMKKTSGEISYQLRIRNDSPTEIDFDLEPYGMQYIMKPGAIFTVLARGPKEDCLEVVYEGNRIAVYGWTGSIVSVLQEENHS